jgi:hypothetical protein
LKAPTAQVVPRTSTSRSSSSRHSQRRATDILSMAPGISCLEVQSKLRMADRRRALSSAWELTALLTLLVTSTLLKPRNGK